MTRLTVSLVALCVAATGPLLGSRDNPTPEEVQKIIERFAAKEAEFAQARQNYIYRQSLRFHEMEPGGAVVGKWEEVWDVLFTAEGKRTERVIRAPVQSLKQILLEPEDLQDLRSVQPFVLTTKDLPKYNVHYLGKETLDEIPCFVFVVKPKTLEKGERYFSGIVWVDDRDLQIVKSYGRGVGIKRSKGSQYPKFETYRQQVDGKYWFPTYTVSNSTLMFENPVPIRMVVRYDDYKQFKAESTITFTDSNIVFEDDVKKPDEKKPEQKKQ